MHHVFYSTCSWYAGRTTYARYPANGQNAAGTGRQKWRWLIVNCVQDTFYFFFLSILWLYGNTYLFVDENRKCRLLCLGGHSSTSLYVSRLEKVGQRHDDQRARPSLQVPAFCLSVFGLLGRTLSIGIPFDFTNTLNIFFKNPDDIVLGLGLPSYGNLAKRPLLICWMIFCHFILLCFPTRF